MKSNCLICKKEFYLKLSARKKGRGKYCSKNCHIQGQVKRKSVNCLNCNKIFTVIPSKIKLGLGKTCSRSCYSAYRIKNRVELKCFICKKTFYTSPAFVKKGKKFCSEACQYSAYKLKTWRENTKMVKRGDKSHLWRGGITSLNDRIRQCLQYKAWRELVFERDNYICQTCFKKGKRINADHIVPFAVIIHNNSIISFEQGLDCQELWDINNGRTLCVPCHKSTDSYLNCNIVKEYLYV